MVFHYVNEYNLPYISLKAQKEQQIKLVTFDKKVLFDLLTDGAKAFCSFQNHGYSLDYYN